MTNWASVVAAAKSVKPGVVEGMLQHLADMGHFDAFGVDRSLLKTEQGIRQAAFEHAAGDMLSQLRKVSNVLEELPAGLSMRAWVGFRRTAPTHHVFMQCFARAVKMTVFHHACKEIQHAADVCGAPRFEKYVQVCGGVWRMSVVADVRVGGSRLITMVACLDVDGDGLSFPQFCDPTGAMLKHVLRHHPYVRMSTWGLYMWYAGLHAQRQREQYWPAAWSQSYGYDAASARSTAVLRSDGGAAESSGTAADAGAEESKGVVAGEADGEERKGSDTESDDGQMRFSTAREAGTRGSDESDNEAKAVPHAANAVPQTLAAQAEACLYPRVVTKGVTRSANDPTSDPVYKVRARVVCFCFVRV